MHQPGEAHEIEVKLADSAAPTAAPAGTAGWVAVVNSGPAEASAVEARANHAITAAAIAVIGAVRRFRSVIKAVTSILPGHIVLRLGGCCDGSPTERTSAGSNVIEGTATPFIDASEEIP